MKNRFKSIYLYIRKQILYGVRRFFSDAAEIGISDPKTILFIRIDRIGDMVLSTPAIRAIHRRFPKADITVLCSRSNQAVLAHNPHVNRLVIFEGWHTMRLLQQMKFDLAIDPYPDYELKTALIAFLSRAKHRIGYASFGREIFFNVKAPEIPSDLSFIRLTLEVLRPLGCLSTDETPEIVVSEPERWWAAEWLDQRNLRNKPIVGIHPGAYYETQRWLPERYAELVEVLYRTGSVSLLVFGSPSDQDLVKQIAGETAAHLITPDLREFIALLSYCKLLIANNSGPLHVAAASGIPTISFMGPTDRTRWMPHGDAHIVLRGDHLPCIGCNQGYCRINTHDCMRFITVEMVVREVIRLLDRTGCRDGVDQRMGITENKEKSQSNSERRFSG